MTRTRPQGPGQK